MDSVKGNPPHTCITLSLYTIIVGIYLITVLLSVDCVCSNYDNGLSGSYRTSNVHNSVQQYMFFLSF